MTVKAAPAVPCRGHPPHALPYAPSLLNILLAQSPPAPVGRSGDQCRGAADHQLLARVCSLAIGVSQSPPPCGRCLPHELCQASARSLAHQICARFARGVGVQFSQREQEGIDRHVVQLGRVASVLQNGQSGRKTPPAGDGPGRALL